MESDNKSTNSQHSEVVDGEISAKSLGPVAESREAHSSRGRVAKPSHDYLEEIVSGLIYPSEGDPRKFLEDIGSKAISTGGSLSEHDFRIALRRSGATFGPAAMEYACRLGRDGSGINVDKLIAGLAPCLAKVESLTSELPSEDRA